MNVLSCLGVLAGGVFLAQAAYAFWSDRTSPINRLLALLGILFSVWAFAYAFSISATDQATAWLWYLVSSPGWCLGPALLCHLLARQSRQSWLTDRTWPLVFLYAPGLLFEYRAITSWVTTKALIWTPNGWDEVFATESMWTHVFVAYYFFYAAIGLAWLHRWGVRGGRREQMQARVIVLTGVPVLAAITLSNVVLRYLEIHIFPGLAPILLAGWGGGIWYSILRYRLLSLTPEVAARQILETMPDALLLLNYEGRVVSANEAASRLFNADTVEATLAELLPEDNTLATRLTQLVPGQPIRCHEICTRGPDGSARYLSASASAVCGELDDKPDAVLILRDITMQKESFAQLSQVDRLASLGVLAGGVAHEINNPLTFIFGNLEILAREVESLIARRSGAPDAAQMNLQPEEILRCMQDAIYGVRRVHDVVSELQAFGTARSSPEAKLDLNEIVGRAVRLTRHELRHRARLVEDLGVLSHIKGSEAELCQVFVSLLVNAAQAVPEGAREFNEVKVRTWAESGHAVAEVADTGLGIPAASLDRIFDLFFTTKNGGAGTGLGLAICRKIVTSQGGEITVESQEGEGSCFRVRLPVHPDEPTEATHPKETAKQEQDSSSEPARILVVDDEPMVCRMVARACSRRHDVVTATSGHEAIEILERDPMFDVILSDVMMPQGTGMELHAWLSQNHPLLATKVIFMCGGAFTSGSQDFRERVTNRFLEKPVRTADLLNTIEDTLRARAGPTVIDCHAVID